MSMLPFIMGHNPHRLLDQDFALALTPEDLLNAMSPMMPREYFRSWRPNLMPRNLVGSTIKSTNDKFQVNLDVQHFAPEEVTVKTADGYIIIEGKHEEKQDEHGFVSRQFTRRYKLPNNCDPDTVSSTLSSDGVLMVSAPKVALSSKDEKTVPIIQTGPVRKVIKEPASQPEAHTDANGPEK